MILVIDILTGIFVFGSEMFFVRVSVVMVYGLLCLFSYDLSHDVNVGVFGDLLYVSRFM